MTEMKSKPLRRRVRCDSNWLRKGKVVLVVYPHGELGFREPNKRQEYRLSLAEAFRQAVLVTNEKVRARIRELRKQGVSRADAIKQARKGQR